MTFNVSSYHWWYFPQNYPKLANKLKSKNLYLVGYLHLVVPPPADLFLFFKKALPEVKTSGLQLSSNIFR